MTGHTGNRWNNRWWFTSEKCGAKGLELISKSHLTTVKCNLYNNQSLSSSQYYNISWLGWCTTNELKVTHTITNVCMLEGKQGWSQYRPPAGLLIPPNTGYGERVHWGTYRSINHSPRLQNVSDTLFLNNVTLIPPPQNSNARLLQLLQHSRGNPRQTQWKWCRFSQELWMWSRRPQNRFWEQINRVKGNFKRGNVHIYIE